MSIVEQTGICPNRNMEQVKRLEAFFKWRVVSIDEDNGDDNTFGKYWEFIDPDKLECWSIKLDLVTTSTHFVHKFKNSTIFLTISHNELLTEMLCKSSGNILIHYETRADEPYLFILCVE
jgi:hypothetical protein